MDDLYREYLRKEQQLQDDRNVRFEDHRIDAERWARAERELEILEAVYRVWGDGP